jgi:hypothetical protein
MYGPPRDCKVEFGRETSLRQCIRPFVESRAPGQDEFRLRICPNKPNGR